MVHVLTSAGNAVINEIVVVTKTGYQTSEGLPFYNLERAQPNSIKIIVLTFLQSKKLNEAFQGAYLV